MNLPAPGFHGTYFKGVGVDMIIPPGVPRGTLLVLPGYNYGKEQLLLHSSLRAYGEKSNLVLVLPEMATSVYESQYFPETTKKWSPIPGGLFLKELIQDLEKRMGLFRKGDKNFLLGVSTGGRGIALVSLEHPDLFTAGAALSGDFNQEKMWALHTVIAVYGPFDQFKERWLGRDNPMARLSEWKMPIYLSTGTEDRIVSPDQTRLFAEGIQSRTGSTIEYHAKNGGHDFEFWDSELGSVFAFYEKYL